MTTVVFLVSAALSFLALLLIGGSSERLRIYIALSVLIGLEERDSVQYGTDPQNCLKKPRESEKKEPDEYTETENK